MGNNLCQWLIISIMHVRSVHHRCKKKKIPGGVGWGEIDDVQVHGVWVCVCVDG